MGARMVNMPVRRDVQHVLFPDSFISWDVSGVCCVCVGACVAAVASLELLCRVVVGVLRCRDLSSRPQCSATYITTSQLITLHLIF